MVAGAFAVLVPVAFGLCFWVLLPWAAVPLAVRLGQTVRTRSDGPSLNGALAGTGMLQLAFCLLLSAGVLLC